jgi:hypothetical protein
MNFANRCSHLGIGIVIERLLNKVDQPGFPLERFEKCHRRILNLHGGRLWRRWSHWCCRSRGWGRQRDLFPNSPDLFGKLAVPEDREKRFEGECKASHGKSLTINQKAVCRRLRR